MSAIAGSGCKPPPAAAPAPAAGAPTSEVQPAASAPSATAPATAPNPAATGAAPATISAAPHSFPDDPIELARLSIEAHAEKIRLISTVKDLETAKAVAGAFPAVDRRHRQLEEKRGSRLLTEEVKQQLDREFKTQMDQLQKEYAREYVRVAFIPGAWEHMHPELTPYADMTVIEQDVDSLERETVRMLTESIRLMQQTTDVKTALELSPKYRVATCRLGSILSRLSVARGGTGIREIQSPQVTALRRQSEELQRRFHMLPGVYHALRFGERQPESAGESQLAASSQQSGNEQVIAELRSQDRNRIINALNRLPETTPDPAHEALAAEILLLLAFEPVRGSAVESIKRGWFSPSQIPQIRAAMPTLEDRGYRYMLAEGISRTPNLDREHIEFLATLFDEEPGKAVFVLRNVGPAAETVAHRYADSTNVDIRKTVCELLKDIGGEASLPTLQKLARDSDRGVVAKAEEAIREIGKPIDQRPHLRDRR